MAGGRKELHLDQTLELSPSGTVPGLGSSHIPVAYFNVDGFVEGRDRQSTGKPCYFILYFVCLNRECVYKVQCSGRLREFMQEKVFSFPVNLSVNLPFLKATLSHQFLMNHSEGFSVIQVCVCVHAYPTKRHTAKWFSFFF